MGLLSNLGNRNAPERPGQSPLAPRILPVHAVSEPAAPAGRERGERRIPVRLVTEFVSDPDFGRDPSTME